MGPWRKIVKNIIRYFILPILTASFLFGVYVWKKMNQPKPPIYISHMTSKIGSSLSTSISAHSSNPEAQVGNILTLTGKVSSLFDTKNLKYSWKLPPYVSLVSGPLEGDISSLPAQQNQNFTISIRVLKTSENDNEIPVRFSVKKDSPTGGFSSARFFTFSQKEKDEAREEIYKNVEEYRQKQEQEIAK